jgi:hypothetical protein
MAKFYLATNHSDPYYVLKTEITGAERGPVQKGQAAGPPSEPARTPLPGDQGQPLSAHGV